MSLLFGSASITSSWYFKTQHFQSFTEKNREFETIRHDYINVDRQTKTLTKYLPQFNQLYRDGLLSAERRLSWVETLQNASKHIKLPALRYKIASQTEYQSGLPLHLGKFTLYSSLMKLEIDMLHEGDLQKLLLQLNQQSEGIYRLSTCEFRRISKAINADITTANITAECDLHWMTIRTEDGELIAL